MSKRQMQRNRKRDRSAINRPVYSNFALNSALAKGTTLQRIYERVLVDIAMSRFKWEGLPPTIDPRFLESTLTYGALSVFYKHNKYGYLALRGTPSGPLNMYDNPVHYQVYGNLFVQERVMAKDCVPIWSNMVRQPDIDIISYQADRLRELDKTIDINIKTQRHPLIVAADETEVFSLQNAYAQVAEGQPVVWGFPRTMSMEALSQRIYALNMGIHPDTILRQQDVKARMWNECMTMLGIKNVNTDKRERMVSDEVKATDDQVDAVKRSALDARQFACEQINRKFNLNVSVEWTNVGISEMANTTISDGEGL